MDTKVIKRILSLALTLCMIVTILPPVAMAEYVSPFQDVDGFWANDAIKFVHEKDWMDGTSETEFSPNQALTRQELVDSLHRMQGSPRGGSIYNFTDVPGEHEYYSAIHWAAGLGIVNGMDVGIFEPESNITREQVATIFYRYTSVIYENNWSLSVRGDIDDSFSDTANVSYWVRDALDWAVGVGLMNGYEDGTLKPGNNISRAEIAKILQAYSEIVSQEAYDEDSDKYSFILSVYGEGVATVVARNVTITEANKPVGSQEGETVLIELKANTNAFISYYVIQYKNGTESYNYLGYNQKKDDTPDPSGQYPNLHEAQRHEYALELQSVADIKEIRVYFITVGKDESLRYIWGNSAITVDYQLIWDMFGKSQGNTVINHGNSANGKTKDDTNQTITMPGQCFGMSMGATLLNQAWQTGITPANFSDTLSYANPSDVPTYERSQALGGFNIDEMVYFMQLTPWANRSQTYSAVHNRCNSNSSWRSFLKAVDSYQKYHTDPVVISLLHKNPEDGGDHAVLATGVTELDDGRICVSVWDPNGSTHYLFLEKTGTNINNWSITSAEYSGRSYDKFGYYTFAGAETLWNLRDFKTDTTATQSTVLFAYVGTEQGNADGIVFTASNGQTATMSQNELLTNIEDAYVVNPMFGDEVEPSNGVFLWLPSDTYTITNTKDSVLTFSLADDFASVDIEIQPGQTAVVFVSDTAVNDCFVSIDGNPGEDFTAEFYFGDILGAAFETMSLHGNLERDSATIQMSSVGLSVVGVDSLDVLLTGFDGVKISNEGINLDGQALVIDGATAKISGDTTQLEPLTNLTFTDGVAAWDDAGSGASGYMATLLENDEPVGNWIEVSDTWYDFGVHSNDYSFAVYAIGDGSLTADSPVVCYAFPQVTQPKNLDFTRGIAQWNPVAGADGYKVVLYKDGKQISFTYRTIDCYYDFSSFMNEPGSSYTFSVTAYGKYDYMDSTASVSSYCGAVIADILSEPENVRLVQGVASWDAVAGCLGYEVVLFKGLDVESETIFTTDLSYDFTSMIENSTYFCAVRAIGDNNYYTDSAFACSNNYSYNLIPTYPCTLDLSITTSAPNEPLGGADSLTEYEGKEVVLQAAVTDEAGQNITGGYVYFYKNGKLLNFAPTAVVGGIAEYTATISSYVGDETSKLDNYDTFTASYAGSGSYGNPPAEEKVYIRSTTIATPVIRANGATTTSSVINNLPAATSIAFSLNDSVVKATDGRTLTLDTDYTLIWQKTSFAGFVDILGAESSVLTASGSVGDSWRLRLVPIGNMVTEATSHQANIGQKSDPDINLIITSTFTPDTPTETNNFHAGDEVMLAVEISGVPTDAIPTGWVTFYAGNIAIKTVQLSRPFSYQAAMMELSFLQGQV